MGFASWLRYCCDVAHWRPTKLCAMLGRLLGWYTIHFRGLLLRYGILPGAKFTLRPSLAFSYIGALLHGTPAAGVSQTLRHGMWNGITELLQRAPPIFGWAAIMLGHILVYLLTYMQKHETGKMWERCPSFFQVFYVHTLSFAFPLPSRFHGPVALFFARNAAR